MPSTIEFAVVDPQPLFCLGLVADLGRRASDLKLVAQGNTMDDAVDIARRLAPSVLLLGDCATDEAIESAGQFKHVFPQIKLLLMASVGSRGWVERALASGAEGCILKHISGHDLANAVRAIHRGAVRVAPSPAGFLDHGQKTQSSSAVEVAERVPLTRREEQVLALVCDGLNNTEIGRVLQLSATTVKHYAESAREKLQVRTRVEAAILFKTLYPTATPDEATDPIV